MKPLMLISAGYNNQKNCAILRFYDTENHKIVSWDDNTNHQSYCYSKSEDMSMISERDDVIEIKKVKKIDCLQDKEIEVNKIIVSSPLAIGGATNSIREQVDAWESDIRYYQTYLFDNGLMMGRYYNIIDNEIVPAKMEISQKAKDNLKRLWERSSTDNMVNKNQFKEYVTEWADLLNQPIPKIKRVAVDIEIEITNNRFPDVTKAESRITAIGFDGTDHHEVYVLKMGKEMGENKLPKEVKVVFFEDEKSMIEKAFDLLKEYPFVLTFNGDQFDMPYMYNRAKNLGILKERNPLFLLRDSATLKEGMHIDIFRVFNNRSLQMYAFNHKYSTFGLDAVSEAMLGEKKIEYEGTIDDMTHYDIANYCYNDSRLTMKLTTYNNEVVMNLLILICRISHMTIDEVTRVRISQWIKNLIYFEHRQRNELIPKPAEFVNRTTEASQKALIEGKKFRGAMVFEPKPGVHFGVTVLDFASLYPTIIQVRNISYETVRCPHKECESNTIEGTNHWACTKKNGLMALLIGSLKDLRVNYYKPQAKDKSLPQETQDQYDAITQALKVFLNASYGVMGAEIFPLYFLPSAEAVTAIGRNIILATVDNCTKEGINVLYGDTDSMFVKKPTQAQMDVVIKKAKDDYSVDLEVDKEYRYVVLSDRKKNYFGIFTDGTADVKGLTGKKSHTPKFIKNLFDDMKVILKKVYNPEDFENAKGEISEKVGECGKKLEAREIPLDLLAFNVMLSKDPDEYTKMVPQHIKVARMLKETREIKKGDLVSYIKTDTHDGVKPTEMARAHEVDTKKYLKFMESVLEQMLEPMNLNFDRMMGKTVQQPLDQYFE